MGQLEPEVIEAIGAIRRRLVDRVAEAVMEALAELEALGAGELGLARVLALRPPRR